MLSLDCLFLQGLDPQAWVSQTMGRATNSSAFAPSQKHVNATLLLTALIFIWPMCGMPCVQCVCIVELMSLQICTFTFTAMQVYPLLRQQIMTQIMCRLGEPIAFSLAALYEPVAQRGLTLYEQHVMLFARGLQDIQPNHWKSEEEETLTRRSNDTAQTGQWLS